MIRVLKYAVILALVMACAATAFAAVVEKPDVTPSNKEQQSQTSRANAPVFKPTNTTLSKAMPRFTFSGIVHSNVMLARASENADASSHAVGILEMTRAGFRCY